MRKQTEGRGDQELHARGHFIRLLLSQGHLQPPLFAHDTQP